MPMVYKDDCAYTCDTQESPDGVDVCLECFIGFSPASKHDFADAHRDISRHRAFLNMKRVPRPRSHNEEESDPKLSVRTEEFDLVTQFRGFGTDEAEWKEQILTVMEAASAAKTDEIDSWELQLQPCEHVAILESLEQLDGSSKNLTVCGECDLSSNLWICLFCGQVSCGRPQFGGGGGNGHALSHFAATQHPLAVKLGSISPEGKADVYCYADDEEVADPQVALHLARWGINVADRTKTEESMTELQLAQNLAYDFVSGADGSLVGGSGYTGMRNLGNTCYLNSVVQALFDLDLFRKCFPPNRPVPEDMTSPLPQFDVWTQLRKVSDGLWSGDFEVINPAMLKSRVGRGHLEFATMRQQDAFEYWGHLLEVISRAAAERGMPDPCSELFGFSTQRRVECSDCKAIRYIVEPQESLTLQVPIERDGDTLKPVQFSTLVDLMAKPEILEDYHCPGCKKTTTAITTTKFNSFPRALVVNARRFEVVNWVPTKVPVPVIIPQGGIDLSHVVATGPQPGENIVDDKEGTFEPDPNALEMLTGAGFPEDKVRSALEATENNAEEAMEKLLDPSFEPATGSVVDTAALEAMGFPKSLAEAALRSTGSTESAVEWLFAGNKEEDAPPPATPPANPERLGVKDPGVYNLRSIIAHKGASVHVGHYVTAIKRGDQWYLFNDERVSSGVDVQELQDLAYIYVFLRSELPESNPSPILRTA